MSEVTNEGINDEQNNNDHLQQRICQLERQINTLIIENQQIKKVLLAKQNCSIKQEQEQKSIVKFRSIADIFNLFCM